MSLFVFFARMPIFGVVWSNAFCIHGRVGGGRESKLCMRMWLHFILMR